MPAPDLDRVRQVLRGRTPAPAPEPSGASVALVFAGDPGDLRLCFIQRTTRPTDPWSGHMALPGGRVDPRDGSPRVAAQRETLEEVGIDLAHAEFLGPMDEIALHGLRRRSAQRASIPGSLAPFSFYAGPHLPALRPDPSEVAEALWFDLGALWSDASRTTTTWPVDGRTVEFPGIQVGPGVVWGLTLRVLTELAQLTGHPLPPPLVTPNLG